MTKFICDNYFSVVATVNSLVKAKVALHECIHSFDSRNPGSVAKAQREAFLVRDIVRASGCEANVAIWRAMPGYNFPVIGNVPNELQGRSRIGEGSSQVAAE